MSFRIGRDKKRKELWELNKTPIQKFKINARIAWRRFDIQTRGMGFVLVIIMVMMITINIIPLTLSKTLQSIESNNYKDSLTIACKDMQFYSLNFKTCEGVDSRP